MQFEGSVPVIQDRVVQEAVLLIIEPIFEADFEDCSYGFRPGRNAHQALERIATALKEGKTEVYDADLAGYFDSIPHDKLMKCLRMSVVDGAVLIQASPNDHIAAPSNTTSFNRNSPGL